MSTPWFFLSYASIEPEHDAYVAKFYSDLVKKLRAVAQLDENVPDDDVGFFAATGIGDGTVWPEALADALRRCRVLICLYSGKYFRSPPCSQEFEIFNSRVDAYAAGPPKRLRPPLILPVLWLLPKGFPKSLPPALARIDYKNSYSRRLTEAGGLYNWISLRRHETEYQEYVTYLATKIRDIADPPVLSDLKNVPPFDSTGAAFQKQVVPSEVLSVEKPRLDKTPPDRWWWRGLVAAICVVIGVIVLVAVIYWAIPRLSLSPPTQSQKIESSEWHDYFDRKLEGEGYVWIKEGDWDYPRNSWKTAPGFGGSETDGALIIQGETLGFTKKTFDNFVARFTVSFLQGTKAGWFLRVGERAGNPVGYKFVLERAAQPSGGLYLSVIAVGVPDSHVSPPTCHVAIYEYGAPKDYIKVEVTAMKNVFNYKFTLMNPDAVTDKRDVIKSPVTVGCGDDFKDGSEHYPTSGRLGFFAEEATVFKIERLTVEPKVAQN